MRFVPFYSASRKRQRGIRIIVRVCSVRIYLDAYIRVSMCTDGGSETRTRRSLREEEEDEGGEGWKEGRERERERIL